MSEIQEQIGILAAKLETAAANLRGIQELPPDKVEGCSALENALYAKNAVEDYMLWCRNS